MSSSWGDSRTSIRFGKTEIWVDATEVDEMWQETMQLVKELKEAHDLMPPERLRLPTPVAGLG